MKITKMEVILLELPMVRSFTTGFGTIGRKETVITKLYTSDGLIGYGESASLQAPIYNHETNYTCFYVQKNFIAPMIVGKSFRNIEDFRDAYKEIVGNRIAKTGPECAFWHLISQRDDKSLKELFGGVKNRIPVGEGVGISSSIEKSLDEVDRLIKNGYRRVKIKICPGNNIELLEKIRIKYPNIDLTIDGNASYSLSKDFETLKIFDKFNLLMIEQPFAGDDLCSHATLQKSINTPVCLDESIESLNDARTAISLKACGAINIKPGRVGGIFESIAIHDEAEKNGIGVWCGGLGETGIGRAFNIAFASKRNCIYPADMSPYHFFYKDDLVEDSFEVSKDGYVNVPDKPGLGWKIRDDKIHTYTVDKSIIE